MVSLIKASSRLYPAETITNRDNADNIALLVNADNIVLLVNSPTQVESLLHSVEQIVGPIGLYIKENKREFMYVKQEGAIYN